MQIMSPLKFDLIAGYDSFFYQSAFSDKIRGLYVLIKVDR